MTRQNGRDSTLFFHGRDRTEPHVATLDDDDDDDDDDTSMARAVKTPTMARASARRTTDDADDADDDAAGKSFSAAAAAAPAATRIGGGALASARSGTFACRDRALVAASRATVRTYDVASGRARGFGGSTTTMDADAEQTCACASPYSSDVVLTGGADGTLSVWNVETRKLMRRYAFGGVSGIYDVVYPGGESGKDFAYVSARAREDGGGRVYRVSLSKGKIVDKLGKTNAPCALVASASGAFVACAERRTIYVWGVGKDRNAGGAASARALRMHHTKAVTALALSHDDEMLAAGDSTGRIVTWHGFAQAVNKLQKEAQGEETEVRGDALPCTTSHWHSRAVGCLHFSADGAHMFSGGEEAVLVIWSLRDGKKTYLPRLGAPLTRIVAQRDDPSRLALFGSDNAVRLVNVASISVEGTIQGVRPCVLDTKQSDAYARAVAYDPRADVVAFSAAGAALQFYDYARDDHIADLAVAPRNYVNTSGELDAPMESHVAHASFSRDGRVLVTVDRRSDMPLSVPRAVEETLKIWERIAAMDVDEEMEDEHAPSPVPGGAFTCVAQCEVPHKGLITCVGVRPSAHRLEDAMAFTAGAEGEVKIWVPNGRVSRGGEHAGWRCRSSASHPSGSAITAGAFSPDGSILATAGSEIVLWDPKTNAKLATLSMPKTSSTASETTSTITSVAFIAGEPLFAVANGRSLVVWNLQTLQPTRVYSMPCVALYAHPTLPTFAAVFSYADDDERSAAKSILVRFVGSDVVSAGAYACADGAPEAVLFVPGDRTSERANAPESTPMLVITRDRQIIRAGAETNREARARDDMDVEPVSVAKRFPGGAVVSAGKVDPALKEFLASTRNGVKALSLNEDEGDVPDRERIIGSGPSSAGKMPWGTLFDSPSHELPTLTTLCPRFMDAMLARHHNADAE